MMKNVAKLALFFSLCFAIVFIAAILFRLLSSWVDYARIVPIGLRPGENALDAAWKALPVAIYLSVLLSLSYSARMNAGVFTSIACIIVLCLGFGFGVSQGLSRASALDVVLRPASPIRGEPGLVLSRSETTIVLLKQSSDIQGPRVVSISGQPLIYQETPRGPNNTILNLPYLPFADNTPWFIQSLDLDLALSAGELRNRQREGSFSLCIYLFSLVLCLGATRFVMDLSKWHLANLFLGALVFRGFLALEIFVNSREINYMIRTFLTEKVSPVLATPLVFCAIGVLILVYTLFTNLAFKGGSWSRGGKDG